MPLIPQKPLFATPAAIEAWQKEQAASSALPPDYLPEPAPTPAQPPVLEAQPTGLDSDTASPQEKLKALVPPPDAETVQKPAVRHNRSEARKAARKAMQRRSIELSRAARKDRATLPLVCYSEAESLFLKKLSDVIEYELDCPPAMRAIHSNTEWQYLTRLIRPAYPNKQGRLDSLRDALYYLKRIRMLRQNGFAEFLEFRTVHSLTETLLQAILLQRSQSREGHWTPQKVERVRAEILSELAVEEGQAITLEPTALLKQIFMGLIWVKPVESLAAK